MKQKDMYYDFKLKITLKSPCFLQTYFSVLRVNSYWDFVNLKNSKIREKLSSGWVGQASTQLKILFLKNG